MRVGVSMRAAHETDRFDLAQENSRRRDAAVAWFENIDAGKSQDRMAHTVARQWSAERGAKAFDYLLAHRERFEGHEWGLVMASSQEALNGGAAAAISYMRRLREVGLELPAATVGGPFPGGLIYSADFDLLTLVESEGFARLPVQNMEPPLTSKPRSIQGRRNNGGRLPRAGKPTG